MRILRLHITLLAATSLGVTLGSCQRDSTARVESANPRREAQVKEPELDSALTKSKAPKPTVVTWHRLKRRTSSGAPLLRSGLVSGAAAVRDTAAPPPSEARLLDLTLKASQFFRIDPTQAAEVRGREGTLVRIPALSLVDGQQKPFKGPVWVELKECYSVADLLLSGCVSTNAAGESLRANGMLLVRATTARGQQLGLASDSALELEVPAEQRHPGLQLYHSAGRRPHRWAVVPVPAPAAQAETHESAVASAESTAVAAVSAPATAAISNAPAELPGSVFRTGKLGWLTCLRPWRPAARTSTLTIPTDQVDSHTTLRLVFPDAAVILEGEAQPDGYTFAQVPLQQRAVLVGLRYFNGNPYVAMREVAPGTEVVGSLEFRETTISEVEELLENL